MRLPRICRRCASAFARNCDSSQRLSPSWRGAGSRRAGHAFGRVGRPCRGRCKYVHVSSVAASMRLTPLHGLPTLPSTVSCGGPPRKKEKKSRSGSRAALAHKQTNKQKGRGERRVLFVFHQFVSSPCSCPPSPGNGRGRGGVGWQDRWRHGWRHRAPMGEGALLAKHCFASARTHSRQRLGRTPEGGSRRVLPTHTAPPNPQKPRAALALALASARRRRTTARQRGTSTSNPIGQLTPVPPMPQ
ncbi:hypothetical protein ABIA73_003286 [Stenotrophomonas sp. 2694]